MPDYGGIQTRWLRKSARAEKDDQSFKVIFYSEPGKPFAEYDVEAKHEHAAWALAHMKFEVDYPDDDAEKYCVEIEGQ